MCFKQKRISARISAAVGHKTKAALQEINYAEQTDGGRLVKFSVINVLLLRSETNRSHFSHTLLTV